MGNSAGRATPEEAGERVRSLAWPSQEELARGFVLESPCWNRSAQSALPTGAITTQAPRPRRKRLRRAYPVR